MEKWEKLGRMRPSAVSLAFLHLLLLPNTFSAAEGATEEEEKSEKEEGEVKKTGVFIFFITLKLII